MKSCSDNLGKKVAVAKAPLRKKRPALVDVTNQKNGPQSGPRTSIVSSKPMVPCLAKIAKKNEFSTYTQGTDISRCNLPTSLGKTSTTLPSSNGYFPETFQPSTGSAALSSPSIKDTVPVAANSITHATRFTDASPSRSVSGSISLDESMSTCDSLKSEDFDYFDNEEVSAVNSFERMTRSMCKRDVYGGVELIDKVVDIDNLIEPKSCATTTADIYKYLRAYEATNRPSIEFMERIQKDINASMRAMLIDWLVEVAEEYKLLPDTLFLTINYIDRYLSGNVMKRRRLQLLGVACMMIAAKFEEISAPQVEEFSYITDHTYFKEEVLQMESAVLNYLKFEMTAPTAICFLRRFVCVAQLTCEVPSLQLECMANYITELSLLDYGMLRYAPSLIAASATFLAKYILSPSRKPWNSTLMSYTFYRTSDLCECVKALHRLFCRGSNFDLPAIRQKYSHHKYKFVAKKYCPQSIPPEFFLD
ncbi:Cyclin [Trema orientale]|uniref:B-like cyclin n=1 Tax=Trema orientale TaxID=63057 RepID=A0A2P5BNI8_TREOI|nr:Cyclin [Trema orientale]